MFCAQSRLSVALMPLGNRQLDEFFKKVPAMRDVGPLKGVIPALYVFGDSTVDSGNNNYLKTDARANHTPFGIDFFEQKATGRFTNGRTIVDFLAQFTGLPFAPPYMGLTGAERKNATTGVNYASGSCGILPSTGSISGTCLFFDKQIELFESTIQDGLKLQFNSSEQLTSHLSNSLFYIGIGSNDYLVNYNINNTLNRKFSTEAFAQHLSDQLAKRLQRLYELGARKFIVPNLGHLGCLPAIVAASKLKKQCNETQNQMISAYNSHLRTKLSELQSTLAGSTFVHLDAHKMSSNILKHPQEIGIVDAWSSCYTPKQPMCRNRDQHFYFDTVHPTQLIYFLSIKHCFEDSSICDPVSLNKLFTSSA